MDVSKKRKPLSLTGIRTPDRQARSLVAIPACSSIRMAVVDIRKVLRVLPDHSLRPMTSDDNNNNNNICSKILNVS